MIILYTIGRLLSLVFITLYQYTLSPLLGRGKCRFLPTCSCYAKTTFKRQPFLKAVVLVIIRLLKCNPWYKKGEWIIDEPLPHHQKKELP